MTRRRATGHLGGLVAGVALAVVLWSRELALGAVVTYLAGIARHALAEAAGRVEADLEALERDHPEQRDRR